VSLLLRGVLVIAALSALKLLLGLFLGIAVLGFAGKLWKMEFRSTD